MEAFLRQCGEAGEERVEVAELRVLERLTRFAGGGCSESFEDLLFAFTGLEALEVR